MSKLIYRSRWLASTAFILTAVSVTPAANAVEPNGLVRVGLNTDESKVAGKESRSSSARPQSAAARSGYLMRCWNFGRLVYEAPVTGYAPAGTNGNVITVPAAQQKQVLDLRSGLCVIE